MERGTRADTGHQGFENLSHGVADVFLDLGRGLPEPLGQGRSFGFDPEGPVFGSHARMLFLERRDPRREAGLGDRQRGLNRFRDRRIR